MRIKHSKYKNTGLIFELLCHQVTSDMLSNSDSAAINIIKKYYSGNSSIAKEYKLYEFIIKNKGISKDRAQDILASITEISRKLNQKSLKKQKYELISEIKEHYDIDKFFSNKIRDYKPLAALYCLLEIQNNKNFVDPKSIIDNRTTLLEHLTNSEVNEDAVKDNLIEEYSKYDKDLRLLTYRFLLEKFNEEFKNFLPDQKRILRKLLESADSYIELKEIVNKEYKKVGVRLKGLLESNKIDDKVLTIKLEEVKKQIKPLTERDKVEDSHLVNLMQYYELLNEIDNL